MSDDPAKPPRFHYVGALLCAACLGAAAWTWMRYSYCWDVTPTALADRPLPDHPYLFRYVRVRGTVSERFFDVLPDDRTTGYVTDRQGSMGEVFVLGVPIGAPPLEAGQPVSVTGRVCPTTEDYREWANPKNLNLICLDARIGRFHGASIAGLVVGAMGVFVFTLGLRHWLGERRKFRGKAGAPGRGAGRARDA